MTVKQGRMQISRPVVVASQTRRDPGHEDTMPGVFFSDLKERGKKKAEVSQDLSTNTEGTIPGRSTPDLHRVFCLELTHLPVCSDPPPLPPRILSAEEDGRCQNTWLVPVPTPQTALTEIGFSASYVHDTGLTETGAQNVVIQQLCLNFHSSKLPFFTVS